MSPIYETETQTTPCQLGWDPSCWDHDEVAPLTEQQLRERYLQQQRRLTCPSCGEEPFLD